MKKTPTANGGKHSAPSLSALSPEQIGRYSRHLSVPEVGPEGQVKLRSASVLIVGAGGLGSPAALYLAAAGMGTIGIADFDNVEISNLQRQILHTTSAVGRSKLDSARERITGLNPDVRVRLHPVRLDRTNALEVLRDYDVVIDATDNFASRYLINDACAILGKPDVYGSVFRFEGQASVFLASRGPCYRCLHPEPPPAHLAPDCATAGVLGVLPGLIGTIQATEAVKLILGVGTPLVGTLLQINALYWDIVPVTVPKDPDCPLCGPAARITELLDYEEWCNAMEHRSDEITVAELAARMKDGAQIQLIDVREPFERELASIGGILIPMQDVPARLTELDPSGETVVYCHTGRRSAHVVAFLKQQGFSHVRNLTGGIEAWSVEIDRTVPRY